MDEDAFFNNMIKFKILFDRDHSNDYYYIQYIASVLDYIERFSNGFLTDLGRQSLSLDVSAIHARLTQSEVKQKDLVRFCLYMTDAYAVSVMFIGMNEVANELGETFFKNNPLTKEIIDDFTMLAEKANTLKDQYKMIMDKFAPLMDSKHKSLYNEEKHKAFVKQIFAEMRVETGSSFRPSDLQNAREVK